MSSNPSYQYSTRVADQPVDAAGRRWITRQLVDAAIGAADGRAELVAYALFDEGGIILRPTLSLTDPDATLTGPALGLTGDGLAVLLVDAGGAGVTLALDELGAAFADGTHSIILKATAVEEDSTFSTPEVPVRDSAGNVVETAASESVTYSLRTSLGVLTLKEGSTIADDEVLVATVALAAGVWSSLTAAGTTPKIREELLADGARHAGRIYDVSNATATTISAVDTPTKVVATTTLVPASDGFTMPADNRLEIATTVERLTRVDAQATVTPGANNDELAFYIAKNGTVIASTETRLSTGLTSEAVHVNVQALVELADGDYVELFVENQTGSDNPTITQMHMLTETS